LIGEGGVAIIARRVNEMGFLYHDRRVDHGIDGEIELVAADGAALNAVVMVQSKASNRRHVFETADSFQWTADAADLEYWLGGNVPVIVVLSRPAEDLAWLVRRAGRVQRSPPPGRAHCHHQRAHAVVRQGRRGGDHAARRAAQLRHLPAAATEERAADVQPAAGRRVAGHRRRGTGHGARLHASVGNG
jgi:hypothetical protein